LANGGGYSAKNLCAHFFKITLKSAAHPAGQNKNGGNNETGFYPRGWTQLPPPPLILHYLRALIKLQFSKQGQDRETIAEFCVGGFIGTWHLIKPPLFQLYVF
jgi:hypothetical protein